ncbi:surface-adhesin E family protein [Brevundimonas sp.]|uniref:surface-adhesin E family protein n=1 Tax=Brevundimonas sp. TaxID=1871086 RepID=UPI00289A37D8|nr:surface-adhesin E family protein [Brevundimonas sp.]
MLSAVLAMTVAFADPAWRTVDYGPDAIWAVDQNSIRVDGDSRTYWRINVLAKTGETGEAYVLVRERTTCRGEEAMALNIVGYRADGVSTGTGRGSAEPDPIIPDTRGAAVHAAVCRGEYLSDHEPYSSTLDFVAAAQSYYEPEK